MAASSSSSPTHKDANRTFLALRIADASSTAHLDKVERGYENMDHYKVEFARERKALGSLDFIQGEES